MKTKVWLLLLLSLVFYGLIHLSGHVPGLLHGQFTLVDERPVAARIISLAVEMSLSFLFSLGAYLFFFYCYPGKRYTLLVFGLLITGMVLFIAGFYWDKTMAQGQITLSRFFRSNVLFYGLHFILGVVFYFVRYSRYRELQEKELQLQVRNAELSFLKSQINPHFLFNNLNNIYSLVYRGSNEALGAIAGLSELLRYMLYQKAETIPLRQEITYIAKYIQLQQLRFETPTLISTRYPDGDNAYLIAPLLLLPFIENAFKHGAPSMDQEWLWIDFSANDETLTFVCTNEVGNTHKDQTGGIGISNVRKRLELLYAAKHVLEISTRDNLFTVKLVLNYG